MLDRQVAEFVSRTCGVPASAVEVSLRAVRGGLESQVACATIAVGSQAPRTLPRRFIVKELRGWHRREAGIYRLVASLPAAAPVARIFGERMAGDAAYLFMEEVRQQGAWPWRDVSLAAGVCRLLAQLHDQAYTAPDDWNYEAHLCDGARDTLDVALRARDAQGTRWWQRGGDLARVVEALPYIQARLRADDAVLIHGDVHPGNVIVSSNGNAGVPRIVLLDWSRARPGSPLEDVAAWLESVGCWEPEARRRHDTLLRAYLDARRVPQPLDRDLRERYWLAAAANGLSGAIRYHLSVLGDRVSTPRRRHDAHRALQAWARVIRRATVVLSTTAPRRT